MEAQGLPEEGLIQKEPYQEALPKNEALFSLRKTKEEEAGKKRENIVCWHGPKLIRDLNLIKAKVAIRGVPDLRYMWEVEKPF